VEMVVFLVSFTWIFSKVDFNRNNQRSTSNSVVYAHKEGKDRRFSLSEVYY
jgi:hypothetical protein